MINDYKKAKRYNDDTINIHNHNNIITKVPTIQRLQYYPLLFLFCFFWNILGVSYNWLNDNNLFIIKCLQISFTNLYGLFNSILFFYVIYNYNSNHVIHRNPKQINIKNKKKKRKWRRRRKRRNSKIKTTEINDKKSNSNNLEEGGVTLTATTKEKSQKTEKSDDLSGPTVSLGVGNISVMSPTSISSKNGDQNNGDNVVALSDIDDDDEWNETEYDLTDDPNILKTNNVTIGYNEDESDEFYDDDDTKRSEQEGNVGIIEEDEINDHQNETWIDGINGLFEKNKLLPGLGDRGGFSLLRNESNDIDEKTLLKASELRNKQ